MFEVQKNIISIVTGCGSTDSCKDLFKNLKILPLKLQYILSLPLFVVTYSMGRVFLEKVTGS
jgi:hypothetical protein